MSLTGSGIYPNNWKRDLKKATRGLQEGSQPTRFPWKKVINSQIVVFGLNSNNYGNWTPIDNAVGNLGDNQLDRLDVLLKEHRRTPVKIVALHHSPNIPQLLTAWSRDEKITFFPDFMELPALQRRRLRDICRVRKVKCICHGHVHIARDRRVEGLRIIGANAATEPIKVLKKKKKYSIGCLTIKGTSNRLYRKMVEVIV